jgi:signal transduction histidine kinase
MDECLIVPVIENGEPFGLLMLSRTPERPFSEQDARMAESLTREHVRELRAGIVFSQTLQQAAVAQILFEVQQSLARDLNPGAIGQLVVDQAQKLVFCRFALLFRYRGQSLCLACAAGLKTQEPDYAEQVERALALAEEATRSGRPVRSPATAPDLGSRDGPEPATLVASPLRSEVKAPGALVVAGIWPVIIGHDEENVLSMLTSAASVVLDNAHVLEQARHLAVLQEREILSQELHDQLAQDLVYLKIQLRVARNKASYEGATETGAALEELACALDGTYAQVRNSIFDLRQPISGMGSFVEALQTYLTEFGERYGIEGTLETEPDWRPEWPPETQVQVVRIIQEALNNVRQHAGPCRVWIQLDGGSLGQQIKVVDDGAGFDPAATERNGSDRFGLTIMQDRASSFGGQVDYQSSPGKGTTLTIRIPEHR